VKGLPAACCLLSQDGLLPAAYCRFLHLPLLFGAPPSPFCALATMQQQGMGGADDLENSPLAAVLQAERAPPHCCGAVIRPPDGAAVALMAVGIAEVVGLVSVCIYALVRCGVLHDVA